MYLSKNHSGVYYLYFVNPVTNKITSRSTKTRNKSEALKFLKTFSELNRPKKEIISNNVTMKDVKDRLFNYFKTTVTKGTYISYLATFDNFIRLIGNKEIIDVTGADIENFKLQRVKEVKPVTVNIDIRNLKLMFNRLVEFEIIPFSKIVRVKQFKTEKTDYAINPEDLNLIINSIQSVQLKNIVKLTLLTASRLGEVLAIKYKDLDFRQGLIHIYQKKTKKYKYIPISEGINALLNEIIKTGEGVIPMLKPDDYLFYNSKKGREFKLTKDPISRAFKRVVRSLGIDEKIKFHSLRHTAITELIRKGNTIDTVKQIAGHRDIATTLNYVTTTTEDIKKAINSLNY
jgi:integrase